MTTNAALIESYFKCIKTLMNDELYPEALELIDSPWNFASCEAVFLKYFRLSKNYPWQILAADILNEDLSEKDISLIRLSIHIYNILILGSSFTITGKKYRLRRHEDGVDVIEVGYSEPEVTKVDGRSARWFVEYRSGILINSYLRVLPLNRMNPSSKNNIISYVVERLDVDGESTLETQRDTYDEAQAYIEWAYEEEHL